MTKRIRVLLGILILTVSIALLVWGYRPLGRETLTNPISPSDLQLPTPVTLQFDPVPVS
jgi:hypothetical protein